MAESNIFDMIYRDDREVLVVHEPDNGNYLVSRHGLRMGYENIGPDIYDDRPVMRFKPIALYVLTKRQLSKLKKIISHPWMEEVYRNKRLVALKNDWVMSEEYRHMDWPLWDNILQNGRINEDDLNNEEQDKYYTLLQKDFELVSEARNKRLEELEKEEQKEKQKRNRKISDLLKRVSSDQTEQKNEGNEGNKKDEGSKKPAWLRLFSRRKNNLQQAK